MAAGDSFLFRDHHFRNHAFRLAENRAPQRWVHHAVDFHFQFPRHEDQHEGEDGQRDQAGDRLGNVVTEQNFLQPTKSFPNRLHENLAVLASVFQGDFGLLDDQVAVRFDLSFGYIGVEILQHQHT